MPHGHIVSIAICHIVPYGAVAIVAVAVGLGLSAKNHIAPVQGVRVPLTRMIHE
jgi:hypothetical protein